MQLAKQDAFQARWSDEKKMKKEKQKKKKS